MSAPRPLKTTKHLERERRRAAAWLAAVARNSRHGGPACKCRECRDARIILRLVATVHQLAAGLS